MVGRQLANIKKFWKSKNDMLATSIALIVTFGICNLMLIGEFNLEANLISSLALTVIIILTFSLSLIVLSMTSLIDRLRVLSNDYHLEFLRIVNVLLFIIFVFYMIMIWNSPFIINGLGKELVAIVGVISTLISFWLGLIKKSTVIKCFNYCRKYSILQR